MPANRHFLRSAPSAVKAELYRKQDGRCHYCGCRMKLHFRGLPHLTPDHATIDHRVPLSRGGRDEEGNRVGSCYGCNSRKGSMTDMEFMSWRKEARCG